MGDVASDSEVAPSSRELSAAWNYFGEPIKEYRDLLEPAFRLVELGPEERFIRQGEAGDKLYIVLSGQLRVVDERNGGQGELLAIKGPGEGVGEIGLLTGERRTASVETMTAVRLLSICRHSLEQIKERAAEAGRLIDDAIKGHVHHSRLNHVIVSTKIFHGLSQEILEELKAELELVTVSSGDIIMRSGDEADALYIVIGGRLRVSGRGSEGDEEFLVDTCRGQAVGEIGLLTGEKRTATVIALRDSLLARLTRHSFQQLLQKYPEAMLSQFATPVIKRLQGQLSGDVAKGGAVKLVAVVPAGRDVALQEFSSTLAKALAQEGSTKHLDSDRCAAQLGTPGIAYLADDDPRNDQFVFWLNEQESSHEFVLYEADYEATSWTKRCLRQADLVLIVANADGSPQPRAIESPLHSARDNQQNSSGLVLLHKDGTALPAGIDRWLAPRRVRSHYHVRLGNEADYRRVGRLITGRGIGLVLSGGGARALAHIGVIRALEESGVPIDAVGAVSGGAIVAGLWGMGLDSEEIVRRSRQATDRIDYTLPLHALTSGNNWTNSMKRLFEGVLIEDLWRSFYCISTDLSQGQLHAHKSGSLMHAVRASTAIPGILPPVFHDGNVLVDGGLINNLPTDLMRAHPDIGEVFAVDVGAAGSSEAVSPFTYAVSGWKSLWNRVNPWAADPAVPSIGEVLMRSISMTNTLSSKVSRRIVDHYFEPPVRSFGLLDFDKIEQLVDVGYRYAKGVISEAKRHAQGTASDDAFS